MSTLAPPMLFRFREAIATMPSVLALIVLVLMGVQQTTKLIRHEDPMPVQIALLPADLTPPPVQPKLPEPPKEKVVTPQPAKPVTPVQPVPVKAQSSAPTNTATPELPSTPHRSSETPAATTPAIATPPAPASPPAPATKPVTASIEAEYVGKIRAHLNSIKRYPTGREASQQRPQGKVRLWFVLRRDGSVVDVGIEESSNSALLDDTARKTINRASFSPFPENSWGSESTHRFTAELEFIPVG